MAYINDTFTDTNGTLLTAHTGETGATWTTVGSGSNLAIIQGNRLQYPGTSTSAQVQTYLASGVSASGDQQLTINTHTTSDFGLLAFYIRADATAQNGYQLNYNSAGTPRWTLYSLVGGVTTSIGTDNTAFSGDQAFIFSAVGSTISVSLGGVTLISVTDTAVTGASGQRVLLTFYNLNTAATIGIELSDMSAADVSAPSSPAHYYISSSGSDSNNGTSTSTPWLTANRANSANGHSWVPGDWVSIKGGETVTGSILVNPSSQPTAALPIIIDSYGSGVGTISCSNSYGVKILNCGNVSVSNIKVSGSGVNVTGTFPTQSASTTSTEGGIVHYSTTASTVYRNVFIDGCEVTGTLQGIYAVNTNTSCTAAGSNFRVTNCYVHSAALQGIYFTGTASSGDLSGQIYDSVYIGDCNIQDIPGISGQSGGVAVRLFNTSRATMERTLCKNTAYATTGYPVSVLLVNSTFPTVRYCEVSYFYTQAGDGDGIDPDLGCTDAVIEHNYIHHGANKTGLFNFAGVRSIFRYNVVENCAGAYRSTTGDAIVHNNTFYNTTSGTATVAVASGSTGAFYNNVLTSKSGATLISAPAGCAFIGNVYDARSGSSLSATINSVTYTTLASLRGAGYETLNGVNYGATGDPVFSAEGAGTAQLPTYSVTRLSAYDLSAGSSAIGAGINLQLEGITPPSVDFHNNLTPTSTIDSGAVRYGSSASSGSTTIAFAY